MKVWYHKTYDMYVPANPWWEDERDDELVEMDIEKEELIVDAGDDDPSNHAGRWELYCSEDRFEYTIFGRIPWPYGKYKITIEPLEEE